MGFGKLETGLILTGYAILSSLLQYSSARIVDKVNDRFSISFIFSILSSLIIAGISYTTNSQIIVAIFISSGALSALCYPFIMAEVGHEAKKEGRIGGTVGFMDWAFSFGNLMGPTTMGLLTQKFGVVGIFKILGLGEALAFLIMFILYRATQRK
jgi:MFS family permease